MKKIFLTIFATTVLMLVWGQTVPVVNSGFENWSGSEPQGWTTAMSGNVIVEIFGQNVPVPVSTNFGSQTSDAHSGSRALKLTSNTVGVPSTDYNFKFPGMAQLGVSAGFNIPASTLLNLSQGLDSIGMDDLAALATISETLSPGDSCSITPSAISMWVKYRPTNSDAFRVYAFTKRNSVPVAYAHYNSDEANDEYTHLIIPFENPGSVCDSLVLIIMASGFMGSEATELYVDDIELDYSGVSVQYVEPLRVAVYPNPTSQVLQVKPTMDEPYDLQLLDLSGKVVKTRNHVDGECSLSVKNLATGIYILEVIQNDQKTVHKVVVQ